MNAKVMAAIALGLVAGLAGGYVLFRGTPADVGVAATVRKPLFYRNPMNPQVTSPVPMKDSMGMDYIPVYADTETAAVAGTVTIDPVVTNNIGLRTAPAERKSMSRSLRAVGRVDYDERKLVRLHPKTEGWIREIRIDKTGQPVANDDILLTIYSPKLVATQREYMLAIKNLAELGDSPFADIREGARSLAASARERLLLLDVPEHQIVELERTGKVMEGLHIHAPAGGTVLEIGARQGQYVTPETELYLIADLATVWVYADIYENELPWVREGDAVEMTLAGIPGRVFSGRVDYIYPYAERQTRTVKLRLAFDNRDGALRPAMYADVLIRAGEQPDQVVIPAEAVVRSGELDQVFVVNAAGSLEPREVRLGVESDGEVAVLSGVDAGERVVVSAQFLVDSESTLREAAAKLTAPTTDTQGAHEGMDHD